MMSSRISLALWLGTSLFVLAVAQLDAQKRGPEPQLLVDSDHDGMSDRLEQALLIQFAPKFMVAEHDCSNVPAEFTAGLKTPRVRAENGTIYGQVFPVKSSTDGALTAEIHYYHLWRKDCGGRGHWLDTEHVSVLVRASDTHLSSARWKALDWYAAAHENTVCDVSQIARASALHAEDHGATIWISPGKHASYLSERLCEGGCGGDKCQDMVALPPGKIINLGEPGYPMNGSTFISSSAWPLMSKMSTSNFPADRIAYVNQLPGADIAWFHPGRHPMQGVIAISFSTEQSIAEGGHDTTSAVSGAGDSTGQALSTANDSTGAALSSAGDATGNALQKSYRHTRHALLESARRVGHALHVTPESGVATTQ